MKSIVEEASSIAKAVEKGWQRAGKPKEFTVKIFEESEYNFLGMTTKPAKVALFFDEKALAKTESKSQPKRAPREKRRDERDRSERPKRDMREQRDRRPARDERKPRFEKQERSFEPRTNRQERTTTEQTSRDEQAPRRTAWTPEMVDVADLWVQGALKTMNAGNITFASRVAGNSLRFNFSGRITGDEDKERLLFSSFANLILATLRSKYKRDFRYLKVVLNTND